MGFVLRSKKFSKTLVQLIGDIEIRLFLETNWGFILLSVLYDFILDNFKFEFHVFDGFLTQGNAHLKLDDRISPLFLL